MKKFTHIFLIILIIASFTGAVNAQGVRVGSDTAKVRMQTEAQNQKQNQKETGSKEQVKTQAQVKAQGSNATGIKKVTSARPDWSKARGARPASVERPSGSRIPKGAGRPGGAKGPGRR